VAPQLRRCFNTAKQKKKAKLLKKRLEKQFVVQKTKSGSLEQQEHRVRVSLTVSKKTKSNKQQVIAGEGRGKDVLNLVHGKSEKRWEKKKKIQALQLNCRGEQTKQKNRANGLKTRRRIF